MGKKAKLRQYRKATGFVKPEKKIILPTKVPDDYLKYKNRDFKPCFGYLYIVEHQDQKPCLFIVNRQSIVPSRSKSTFSFIVEDENSNFPKTIATVEMKKKKTQQEFYRIYNEQQSIKFIAYPNYQDRYKDSWGLSVIPLNIREFVADENEIDCDRKITVTSDSGMSETDKILYSFAQAGKPVYFIN